MLMLDSRTASLAATLHTLGVTLMYGILVVYKNHGWGEVQRYVRHRK
jgi:hypothetical protein